MAQLTTGAPTPRQKYPQVALISGGQVFNGEGFSQIDVRIEGQQFGELVIGSLDDFSFLRETPDAVVVDASDCFVVPGFVDLHFHGAVGADFSDGSAEGLSQIAKYEASRGVCAICPATMTLPQDVLERACAVAAQFECAPDEAQLVGINMEGPYISAGKVGAQNPAHVRRPDADEFKQLQRCAGGLIKLVDLAPEVDGAAQFIRQLSDEVCISVAHTDATYEQAHDAFVAGARHLTHMFNAMPALHHRSPGPIAAASEQGNVTVELIADGVHVHPAMVRLAFALFGENRVVLISDSLRACGLGDGTYDLGGQDVHVVGTQARIDNGSLAGSVTDLAECFRIAVTQMGISLESAVKAASANPARVLGVDSQYGAILPGYKACAVLLDRNTLKVKQVINRGRLVPPSRIS